MSSIYVTEPATRGKLVLHTTLGPIDIELWPKEAPKACRNFVQLCLEGYYNGTLFHKVIKDVLAQGGDPTGTGSGGESIYGPEGFPTEIHSRLRFTRRGLVAMAGVEPDMMNHSQFFITLGECQQLNRKYTIFGKVTGDTIFNVLKLNSFEVDSEDRPAFPPKINSIEVLAPPFDDIVPRVVKTEEKAEKKAPEAPKPKATKNLALLSFGDEAEGEEEEEAPAPKMKFNPALKVVDPPPKPKPQPNDAPASNNNADQIEANTPAAAKQAKSFEETMRAKIAEKRKMYDTEQPKKAKTNNDADTDDAKKADEPKKKNKIENKEWVQKRLMKKLFKKKKGDDDTTQEDISVAVKRRPANERDVLSKLEKFKKSLAGKSEQEKQEEDWRNHSLQFPKEVVVKDPMARNDEEYTVYDPLQNKKEKTKHERHMDSLRKEKKLDKW